MEHPLSQFRYCPKCGSEHFEIHNEKSKQCKDCGFVYYFNSSAATVALILNGRNDYCVPPAPKNRPKGHSIYRGGFIDMAETGEEGVAREVKEETGNDSDTSRIPVFITEHLYLFGISRAYAGPVFPLYGSRYPAFRSNGRCGGSLLPSAERHPPGRFRAGLHP